MDRNKPLYQKMGAIMTPEVRKVLEDTFMPYCKSCVKGKDCARRDWNLRHGIAPKICPAQEVRL